MSQDGDQPAYSIGNSSRDDGSTVASDTLTDEELDNIGDNLDDDYTADADPDIISTHGTVWVKDGYSGGYGTSVSMDVRNPETGEWVQARHTQFRVDGTWQTVVGSAGSWDFTAGLDQPALDFLPDTGPVTVDLRVNLHGAAGACLPLSEKSEATSSTDNYTKNGCSYIIEDVDTGEKVSETDGSNVQIDFLLGEEPSAEPAIEITTPPTPDASRLEPGELTNVQWTVEETNGMAVENVTGRLTINGQVVEDLGLVLAPNESRTEAANIRVPEDLNDGTYDLCVEYDL